MVNVGLWIVFGALAGWVASIVMQTESDQSMLLNIVIGLVGAVAGGFFMRMLGGVGITGFNLPSFLVSVAGAVFLLFIFHAIKWRTAR